MDYMQIGIVITIIAILAVVGYFVLFSNNNSNAKDLATIVYNNIYTNKIQDGNFTIQVPLNLYNWIQDSSQKGDQIFLNVLDSTKTNVVRRNGIPQGIIIPLKMTLGMKGSIINSIDVTSTFNPKMWVAPFKILVYSKTDAYVYSDFSRPIFVN